MKGSVTILTILALTSANPKFPKLSFRNFYKTTLKTVDAKPRIVGGQEATPHSLPYQAAILSLFGTYGLLCTGSLISQMYVITSASCIDKSFLIIMALGAHNPAANESTQGIFFAGGVKIHEEYDGYMNDIGLIRLYSLAGFTHAIKPIYLPDDENNNYLGALTTVSGYHLTGNDTVTSGPLNFIQVRVIANEDCEEFYGTLPESVLCTSANGATVDSWDLGGPLVTDGFLIGILSSVSLHLDGPLVFTRVTSFLNWIRANTDVS